jgi:hypothetical protein
MIVVVDPWVVVVAANVKFLAVVMARLAERREVTAGEVALRVGWAMEALPQAPAATVTRTVVVSANRAARREDPWVLTRE